MSSTHLQTSITIPAIGVHHSPLTQKFGTPRQPNLVDIHTSIEILAPYNQADAFVGIDGYSHLWIIWQFHLNRPQANFKPQVRPPRLGGNKKLGVFATRSMYRPSGLGMSVVKFKSLTQTQDKLFINIIGADMIDKTPIIDIKPYLSYSDSISHAESGFATTAPNKKQVQIHPEAHKTLNQLVATNILCTADIDTICQLIAQDPRPAYRHTEIGTQFIMRYQAIDISFSMDASKHLIINSVLTL